MGKKLLTRMIGNLNNLSVEERARLRNELDQRDGKTPDEREQRLLDEIENLRRKLVRGAVRRVVSTTQVQEPIIAIHRQSLTVDDLRGDPPGAYYSRWNVIDLINEQLAERRALDAKLKLNQIASQINSLTDRICDALRSYGKGESFRAYLRAWQMHKNLAAYKSRFEHLADDMCRVGLPDPREDSGVQADLEIVKEFEHAVLLVEESESDGQVITDWIDKYASSRAIGSVISLVEHIDLGGTDKNRETEPLYRVAKSFYSKYKGDPNPWANIDDDLCEMFENHSPTSDNSDQQIVYETMYRYVEKDGKRKQILSRARRREKIRYAFKTEKDNDLRGI